MSYVDSTGYFFDCYEMGNRIDNSRNLPDLDGNYINVGFPEITVASYVLFQHNMIDPSI